MVEIAEEEPRKQLLKKQVFISHSSKDEKLVDFIEFGFRKIDVTPFFARRHMRGENPAQKIVNEIEKSLALFAIMTSNVLYDKDTRDWVVFEIGVAKGKGKPIFCWKERDREIPKLIEYLTDYETFDLHDRKDCIRVVQTMVDKALELKEKKEGS